MADEKKPDTEKTQDKPKKASLKIMMMVAVAMIIEAGVLLGAAMMTKTPEVSAESFAEKENSDLDRLIEIPVLNDRLSNSRQGVVYLYETEIVIQVKARHEEDVTKRLEENTAHTKMVVSTLWRQAEPRYFDEPQLSTLTRQVEEELSDIVGEDPKSGDPYIEGVLIPVLRGFPANY